MGNLKSMIPQTVYFISVDHKTKYKVMNLGKEGIWKAKMNARGGRDREWGVKIIKMHYIHV